MTNNEIESKLELSADDFEILRSTCEVIGVTEQLNIYYDSGRRLASSGSTFRVRLTPGREPIVTLKVQKCQEGARRESLEIEHPFGARVYPTIAPPRSLLVSTDLPDEFAETLCGLGIDVLERVGWTRNTRWIACVAGGPPIELDRTSLPDGSILHEAEIENDDLAVHQQLVQVICGLARSAKPSTMSKFERFAAALGTSGAEMESKARADSRL